MTITPVQSNIQTPQATYRDAKKPIKTRSFVHPNIARGHLVHDSILSVPIYWLKDIAYDVKAVKDGIKGTAKDHQLGRLNDVGLKLGGIGIATYLASQTTDPKMRLMEYLGLGSFLACMSLYPMIAINTPSRLVQGYDIGKEYIDDQGRKKSVFQDGNYIPYDLYRGEYKGENLDIIGDRMGIPRDIKNRHELVKEQMRKIAIQNNTLWMLGAGFATPVMTALLCTGLEQLLTPAMEYVRNKKSNSTIADMLRKTEAMSLNVSDMDFNSLARKVKNLLSDYQGKELPKTEFDRLFKLLASGLDDNLQIGIKEDLNKMLREGNVAYALDESFYEDVVNVIKTSSTGYKKDIIAEIFKPTRIEIEDALEKAGSDKNYITEAQLKVFKGELAKIFKAKIEASSENKDTLYMRQSNIIENISKFVRKTPSSLLTEEAYRDITDLAKVLGEFKDNDKILDKCKSVKVEYAPETMLARSYKKFENILFDALDIKIKDLEKMKESDALTKKILENKIQALVKNEAKYQKTVRKLAKVMADTEVRLHGKSDTESYIKDLISAYENNYNRTAKRIHSIGEGKFANTINRLIKENVHDELENTVKSREDLFDLIDGIRKPFVADKTKLSDEAYYMQNAEVYSKGVGSSKELAITRIIDRIQGVENSQRRMLHVLDFFKREVPKDEYGKHLNEVLRSVLLQAASADHTLKLNTDNNPNYYIDLMKEGWDRPVQKQTEDMVKAVGNDVTRGDIFGRFLKYLKRFRDIMGQNDIDFKKPGHRFGEELEKLYSPDSQTMMQKFNLVAQNPVDFFKKAAKTRFENQMWLRKASKIGGIVIAATVLAQFSFGKVKNPHNIQKQVNDDNIG